MAFELGASSAVRRSTTAVAYANKTAAYTITSSDAIITADASGGAFNVTLPAPSTVTGQTFTIKRTNSGSNVVTVAPAASETIDGLTSWPLTSQNATVTVVSDGTNWQLVAGYRNTVDVQTLIASGTTTAIGTWTKPPGARVVQIAMCSGGGGGGSGRRGAAGTVRCGGGGGNSGNFSIMTLPASDLNATEPIQAGGGGAGGAAVTTDNTNGNPGVLGDRSFIRDVTFCKVAGGVAASGGTASSGTGGSGWSMNLMGGNGSVGGAASVTGGVGASGGSAAGGGGTGGGGGGGITSADVASAGGAAANHNGLVGGTAGAAGGGNGGTATSTGGTMPSVGGGGGGGSITSAGGNGGNGALNGYAGGGGGGGASLNGFNSGAGGNGSPGFIIITTFC